MSPYFHGRVGFHLDKFRLVSCGEYLWFVDIANAIETKFVAISSHHGRLRLNCIRLDNCFLIKNCDLESLTPSLSNEISRLCGKHRVAFDDWLDMHAVEEY